MDHVTLIAPAHRDWLARFARHEATLAELLPNARIEHIGSTSLGWIRAKDVVDIMVGVPAGAEASSSRYLAQHGYVLEAETPTHAWHCWPSAAHREAVVHVLEHRGRQWDERILFRDYLRQHHDVALEYAALKTRLAQPAVTWTQYTAGKACFVAEVVAKARGEKPSSV